MMTVGTVRRELPGLSCCGRRRSEDDGAWAASAGGPFAEVRSTGDGGGTDQSGSAGGARWADAESDDDGAAGCGVGGGAILAHAVSPDPPGARGGSPGPRTVGAGDGLGDNPVVAPVSVSRGWICGRGALSNDRSRPATALPV